MADQTQDKSVAGFLSYLEAKQILTVQARQRASAAFESSAQPFDTVMTELGLIREEELADHMGRFFEVDPVQSELRPNTAVLSELPIEFLVDYALLPLEAEGEALALGVADPFARDPIAALAFQIERPIALTMMPRRTIIDKLAHFGKASLSAVSEADGGLAHAGQDDLERLRDFAREAPIVRFVADTIDRAVDGNATDIHVEPLEDQVRIRFRRDGMLQVVDTVPRSMLAGISTRIKILSRLNIAERRLPQDGRMRIAVRGRDIDMRVSIMPAIHGETLVLRILDRAGSDIGLDRLGFDDRAKTKIRKLANVANGIILVTGPTGSGKTTTLYSILSELARPERKIFTVEDPVEYRLAGVTQLQANPTIGLDFATALRSILRQDPDVILVGEIRDRETAQIAMQAALTGHLVFSTLHTNSAAGALTRLRDMGVDGHLLGATVRGVIAQRLLRKKCQTCLDKTASTTGACLDCKGAGYAGRTVTYEILEASPPISRLMAAAAAESDIAQAALHEGMIAMAIHANSLVQSGVTTEEEVHRVLDQGGEVS